MCRRKGWRNLKHFICVIRATADGNIFFSLFFFVRTGVWLNVKDRNTLITAVFEVLNCWIDFETLGARVLFPATRHWVHVADSLATLRKKFDVTLNYVLFFLSFYKGQLVVNPLVLWLLCAYWRQILSAVYTSIIYLIFNFTNCFIGYRPAL